jgi:hypothetical protein
MILCSYTLACQYANNHAGFPSFPIYAILYDGICFEFFSFHKSIISRGVFRPPSSPPVGILAVAQFRSTTDLEFIASLRPICETLFYFFLLTYKTGMESYMERSVAVNVKENHPRDSTPGWKDAHKFACQAFTLAVCAAKKAAADDDVSDEMLSSALEYLRQRSASSSCSLVVELITFLPFPNVASQPFLILSGKILTYFARGMINVLNFAKVE